MSENHVGTLVLAFILLGMVAFVNQVHQAEAAETIYIRSNGIVDPSTANITNVGNVTYILTSDIVATSTAIVIERDNILVDGAGHTVETAGWNGTEMRNRNNVTIRNFSIRGCYHGIFLDNSTLATIDNNTFTGNTNAITSGYTGASNCTITNNNMTGNNNDLYNLSPMTNTVISGNIVKQCDYGLVMNLCVNVTMQGNLISDNTWGIWHLTGANNSIIDNTITSNGVGVVIDGNYTIYHNRFVGNTHHVQISLASHCQWDNGYPSGGNYWSGYISPDLFSGPYQNIQGGDGIGDNLYVINSNNKDNYPFMLLSICNVSQIPTGQEMSPTDHVGINATITHLYTLEHVTLNYAIANGTGTFNFSVSMTNLEGNVWNATIPPLSSGTNVTYTVTAHDNEGNTINSQEQGYTYQYQVIPEFSSIILLSFAITTLLASVIAKRRIERNTETDKRA